MMVSILAMLRLLWSLMASALPVMSLLSVIQRYVDTDDLFYGLTNKVHYYCFQLLSLKKTVVYKWVDVKYHSGLLLMNNDYP